MVFREKFWEDSYWSNFGSSVWLLFKTSTLLLNILGSDESARYVEKTALLAKYIVEKLSEFIDIEEPEEPGARGADLVTLYMRMMADLAIGKNPTVTLAWIFRNISFEYARASFETIRDDPRRFDYLANILGLRVIYEPPELLTGGEIDLSLYHAPGYLDNLVFKARAESLGGGRFKYILEIGEKVDLEKQSVGALIVRLGLLSWEILGRKPGIFSIYEATDARTMYLELASTKIPTRARELVEEKDIIALGSDKIYFFKDEYIGENSSINLVYESDTYQAGVPMPKACSRSIYSFKGPLVFTTSLCASTDLLLRETKVEMGKEERKTNIVEFLRGIHPYIFLGVWDLLILEDKILLISRI